MLLLLKREREQGRKGKGRGMEEGAMRDRVKESFFPMYVDSRRNGGLRSGFLAPFTAFSHWSHSVSCWRHFFGQNGKDIG